ncbi:hypothetical protein [Streptomyces sp. NPDC000618]|uniref:hypothetical protein n=1 Tax=Streptomyces sp. NPDC000618 TaxID=3154265 RepID=UPI00331F7ABA
MKAAPDKKTSARTSATPAHQAAPAQARATVEEPTSPLAASGPEGAPPAGLTPQQLRLLQAGAGNAAVARLVVQRQAAGAPAVDAPAPPVKTPPSASPAFQNLKSEVRVKKTAASRHAPAATESKAAQNAAVAPPDDKQAQGKAAQAEKMNAAKPGVFDKAGFIAAVNQAIAAQAPKNLDEADNFSGSGKAEAVKGQVSGQVSQGKAASAKEIDTATKAGPDLSKAQDKPVTPLTPDAPPPVPGAPNPAGAVPATQPDAVTDFSGGPQQVDQQMAEAEVTEDQLAKGNEPQFTDALAAKKEGEQHSAAAPGAARGAEAKQLAAAKQGAAATGAQAMTGLAATRTATGKQVDGGKGAAKSADERKRAEVTARLQKVFDTTKTDVESTLSGLDKLVDEKFTAGEKAARDAFTADHKRRMDAYKDKRYSGWTGKLKWVKDKFAGMPEEANQLFQESRKLYVAQMQQVISSIADVIGTELGRAKDRIAKGRAELKAEVDRLPADLKKFGQDAAKDFTEKFDGLEADVNAKSDQLVQDLAQKYTQAVNAVDDEIKKLQDENKGLIAKAKDAVVGVIQTIIELKNMLLGVLAKAATAVMNIIKDPIGFLRNLVTAVAAGLHQFIGNITEHLKKGLISWLLGTAVSAGLALPAKFDLKGIIQLIGGMLGLTWANIRARITRKGVPDQAVTAAEQSVPVAQALQKEGPAGAVEHIKASVGDLKSTILQKLTAYLIPTVIVAGITWIVSLLNPASAFIRAVKGIIDIVTFVVTQGAQIMQFVNSVLDAVIAIAGGGQAGVPALIEGALVASIPVLIGFLAALLGVGNLANKVKEVFHAVAKPVSKAIDKIVDFIAKASRKLWKGISNKASKKNGRSPDKKPGTGKEQGNSTESEKDKTDASAAALREATSLVNKDSTVEGIREKLPGIKSRHNVRILQLIIDSTNKTRTLIHFKAVNSPPKESKQQTIPNLSNICGPLKEKIDEILPQVRDAEVRAKLEGIKEEADKLEDRIKRGQLPEAADRLKALRDLGDRVHAISEDARILHLLEKGPDFSKLGITVGEAQVISPGETGKLTVPADAKILYVVRDRASREILKVGETTAGSALEARFDRYDRAARRLQKNIEIEVRVATLPEGEGIRHYEQRLRNQVDWGARNKLPWDNTEIAGLGPRLGRRGPGTPFEPLPGGSPLRKQGWTWNEKGELVPPSGSAAPSFRRSNAPPTADAIRTHLATAGGDVQVAAAAANVTRSTFYRWIRLYNINISDYR